MAQYSKEAILQELKAAPDTTQMTVAKAALPWLQAAEEGNLALGTHPSLGVRVGSFLVDYLLGGLPDTARRVASGEGGVLAQSAPTMRGGSMNPLNYRMTPEGAEVASWAAPSGGSRIPIAARMLRDLPGEIVDAAASTSMAGASAMAGRVKNATKMHGTAVRSGRLAEEAQAGGTLTADRLKDSSQAVAERRKHMIDVLSRPVDPWVPDNQGSYFDRNLISSAMQGHPGVTQADMPRISPTKRANLAPAQNLFSPENTEIIKLQADRGAKLGGETYYPSTYPLRARYGELNGPISFDDFVNANAATSPQTPLPLNIPNATIMLYMKKQGIEPTWENAQKIAQQMKDQHGVGFFLGPSHVGNWNNAQAGGLTGFDAQQKIASYAEALRGNFNPYVIDTHETKGLSMGTSYFPYFDKQKGVNSREYGTIERSAQNIAKDLNLPPANMQAGRWFGGGELTGLKSPRGDYLNTFEDLVRWNAEKRGWDTSRPAMQQKIDQVLQGDEILLPYWRKTPLIEYDRGKF